ncbi:MAG: RagB/SusD family nutrient uptake outer membrane protein [Bacteroidota bacterium]
MKSIRIFSLILLAAAAVSCSESFLDTEPLTSKTDGNYYTTPEEMSTALVGCYDALQLIWSGDGWGLPIATTIMSDQCFGGTGVSDVDDARMIDEFDKSVLPTEQNLYEGNWANYYQGIFRCNKLLMNMETPDWKGQLDLKAEIEGEARFLRAFFYFDLVRMFERVPLLTVPTIESVPQAHPDSTYTLITNDLLFAAENCTDKTYGQIGSTEYGHATQWAAKSLLARVFLFYTGYYGKSDLVGLVTQAEALAHLEDVITKSGHGLVENFADLWPAAATYEAAKKGLPISQNTYAGETNKEVVFAIKYTYTSDYNGNTDGNGWMVMNGLRSQAWAASGYGMGWGACSVIPEVYTSWDSKDTRREASIMAIAEEGINFTKIKDAKEYSGYFTKKYIPTCDSTGTDRIVGLGGVDLMIGQFQDYFAIRYADVLLMAAELGSPNALQYVNEVRIRAKVTPVASVDKDVIYEERRLELAFEGHRYWDLLRYDNTLQYAADAVSFTGTVKTGGIVKDKIINGSNLIATRGLFQIPNNQITLSNYVLTQNAGW